MKLDFIELGKLSVSRANMRYAKKAPDVSDLLPTVRARGILVPLIVRPNCAADRYEIVAGARRYTAARLIAEETEECCSEPVLLPCAIIDDGDNAAAIEASLIENVARRDADEMSQWTTFVRLIKEGRSLCDISATFGIPELGVKRILALGNLLPRIRNLYGNNEIDAATVRHLTLASKAQQKAWLALYDDPQSYRPTGHQLKSWLFGGQSIKVDNALFDVEESGLAVIADLFGEDRYFADCDAFWTAQNAAIEQRRAEYINGGWSDVVIVPPSEYFNAWEYEKAGKRKGGRVYIDLRQSGEVTFHEGYVTRKEARRLEKGESLGSATKAARPELTSTLSAYVDLHRHAAVRAAMTEHPRIALRLMVAHAICGSHRWSVRVEPQTSRNEAVRESVEVSKAETDFDTKRRAVLELLSFWSEEPTVTRGNGDAYGLVGLFIRLLELPDAAVMDVIAIVMGESLAAGSAAVDAVGVEIGIDMSRYWKADDAFFECLRDKVVLTSILAEIAGDSVAAANVGEKNKVLKSIIRDHLDGANGRARVNGWVPKWMAFPPSAYTARGGVGSVDAAALVAAARIAHDAPHPDDSGPALALPVPEVEAEAESELQALAA
jgi:ParB family transcriptional regulator, chromosome partitioning protein